MTTTQQVSTYPKEVSLRDGSTVIFRPLDAGDEAALLLFFGSLSENGRYYLKDNVTSPAVISQWVHAGSSGRRGRTRWWRMTVESSQKERSWDFAAPREGT